MEHGACDALTKADQMAWEAPATRPVTIERVTPMEHFTPCPDWCTGEGLGHQPEFAADYPREREGAVVTVRQEAYYTFFDYGAPLHHWRRGTPWTTPDA